VVVSKGAYLRPPSFDRQGKRHFLQDSRQAHLPFSRSLAFVQAQGFAQKTFPRVVKCHLSGALPSWCHVDRDRLARVNYFRCLQAAPHLGVRALAPQHTNKRKAIYQWIQVKGTRNEGN
jgi:hypothetical protein